MVEVEGGWDERMDAIGAFIVSSGRVACVCFGAGVMIMSAS